MTTAEMIDLTGMRTLYAHRGHNPNIQEIFQVQDNNEELLAKVGDMFINGDVVSFEQALKNEEVKMITGFPVPETNAVKCLYLPPYYLFTDLKKEYK